MHAVVVRRTFVSEKAKNTSRSDHFRELRCRNSAHHCGAKHISKSKCIKHTRFRPLLEVDMSKKCTPLWREAHFEVKMLKAPPDDRATFGRGRRKGLSILSKVSKVTVLYYFQLQPLLHHTTPQYTTQQLQLHLHYIPLHYTTLHSTTLHYTQLH